MNLPLLHTVRRIVQAIYDTVRLRLGTNLLNAKDGKVKLLLYPHGQTVGLPRTVVLRRETVNLLNQYVTAYRPSLLPERADWLFPGREGRPKSADGLRLQVNKAIFKMTGLKMTPNAFRHLAAKHYLDKESGRI